MPAPGTTSERALVRRVEQPVTEGVRLLRRRLHGEHAGDDFLDLLIEGLVLESLPFNEWLLASFPVDAVVEDDFGRGNVDSYKVVVDTDTMILDEPLVAQIEKWVRAGGIFVTFGQTGRHTSTAIDSWPISRLTGYAVLRTDVANSAINLAPGQPVFDHDYWAKTRPASGLALKKAAPECRDLMVWDNGTTAVGMRPLGKGCVFDLGSTPESPRLLGEILSLGRTPDRSRHGEGNASAPLRQQ